MIVWIYTNFPTLHRAINTSLQQVVYQDTGRNLVENKKLEIPFPNMSHAKANPFGAPSYCYLLELITRRLILRPLTSLDLSERLRCTSRPNRYRCLLKYRFVREYLPGLLICKLLALTTPSIIER
jgi:hypothetical protein